ncbi:MAG: hypothetical protein GC206_05070 [Alphaproteobacteria bacterium]|nr:hypothetical protein [Alphaproteobacteria bacterium]
MRIACYFIVPMSCADGVARMGYDDRFRTFGLSDGAHHLALDLRLLRVALQQAATLRDIEASSFIGVSVHASTMRHAPARHQYLRALATADPDLQRRCVVKIAEIENGARARELAEWVAQLRRHVRQAALEFHALHRAPNDLDETRAWAGGVQLHLHPDEAGRPSAAARETSLRHWRAALSAAGMRFYVDNVRSRAEHDLVASLNVDFITSARFWPPLLDLDRLAG